MKIFIIKMINCILIISVLFTYQSVAKQREKEVLAFDKKVKNERKEWEKESIRLSGKANESHYKDGTYRGKGKGFGGDIIVEIIIKNDEIKRVDIISAKKETPDYVKMMSSLTQKIVDEQGTDVDVVSGATFSSNGVLEAVENALSKAGKQ